MENKNYFFGNGDFKDILTCLSTTTVHSYQTSSIPLAEFWKPSSQLQDFMKKFKKETGINITDTDKFFEYPTECLDANGKKAEHSRPSMTDLMLINDTYQIAIEGKYTEYSKSKYEAISEWNKENAAHKQKIQDTWFNYIKNAGATSLPSLSEEVAKDVPYQFLHRTASACRSKTKNKMPILMYQLFYDDENEKEKDTFTSKLKDWAEKLGFTDKIKFYVIAVKITNKEAVKKKYDGIRSDIFLIMKNQTIYEFDWENIAIEKIN